MKKTGRFSSWSVVQDNLTFRVKQTKNTEKYINLKGTWIQQAPRKSLDRSIKVRGVTYLVTHFDGILHITTYSTALLPVILYGFDTSAATLQKTT
jgi:hypothetical protein